MESAIEAFLLLSLPNSTLRTPSSTHTGILDLECVTLTLPNAATTNPSSSGVYLVFRINTFETPIDPACIISLSLSPSFSPTSSRTRTYAFDGTPSDPSDLVLTISPPSGDEGFEGSVREFEGILAQYADFRRVPEKAVAPFPSPSKPSGIISGSPYLGTQGDQDLRGHIVLVNQESGEVVGEVDGQFAVMEDREIGEKGKEDEPVVIEIPERGVGEEEDAMQMFVRIVPPEERDWITNSATVVSHAISSTTNLLLTTITSASSYYMSHSQPSLPPTTTPTQNPSPALVFLTSESTRQGLTSVHALSGHAVSVSAKTVELIDGMIRRTMGGKAKAPGRARGSLNPTVGASSLVRSPSPSGLYPYPYANEKPALPLRQTPSPSFPPAPGMSLTPSPVPPRPALSTKTRLMLSADLILTTLDQSARQVLDVGGERIGAVVGHKYGPDAVHTSLLAAGTARNVGLVYIDMRGIGRKALLRQAGREFVKGRMGGAR